MRCIRCNANWDCGNITPPLMRCPVCGADFSIDPTLREYSNVRELLYDLRVNDLDTFMEPKRVLAYIYDLFPEEVVIRDELKNLYEKGMLEIINSYLDKKISGQELSAFIKANTNEDIKSEIIILINYALSAEAYLGTDFNHSDYYLRILNILNDDKYRISALEKAAYVDDDASIREQLNGFRLKEGNVESSINDLEREASNGDPKALFALAKMYKDGSYYKKDLYKALELFNSALEKGNIASDYMIADILLELDKESQEAIDHLRKAADNGNVKALCRLYSVLYPTNASEAIAYLRKAAFLNCTPAMYEYSLHLLYGDDVEQDINSAIRFLEEAALRNDSDAICKLEYLYSTGFIVTKDVDKAKEYKAMIKGENDYGVI